jgi:hypothetical protein
MGFRGFMGWFSGSRFKVHGSRFKVQGSRFEFASAFAFEVRFGVTVGCQRPDSASAASVPDR